MKNTIVPNIKIDGVDILFSDILAFEFSENINTVSNLTITIAAQNLKLGSLKYTDFQIGNSIKVSIGLDVPIEIFSGEITELEVEFNELKTILSIRASDYMHRLNLEKKTRPFNNRTDAEIVKQIAGEWNLSADVDDTQIRYPYISQYNQSDLSFILQRAYRIFYEVRIEDKTLLFQKSKENSIPLALEYMIDFTKFKISNNTCYQRDANVQSYDFRKKQAISGKARNLSAKKNFEKSAAQIVDETILDIGEAEKIAKAYTNMKLAATVTGEGFGAGNPKIRIGKMLLLSQLGPYSNKFYVTATRHFFHPQEGYYTEFWVRGV